MLNNDSFIFSNIYDRCKDTFDKLHYYMGSQYVLCLTLSPSLMHRIMITVGKTRCKSGIIKLLSSYFALSVVTIMLFYLQLIVFVRCVDLRYHGTFQHMSSRFVVSFEQVG